MIAKMKRSLWVGIAAVVAFGALVVPMVASQQKVSATIYEVGGKVTICHRTTSNENSANPYNQITVRINAAGANGLGDHYENHTDNLGVVIYNAQIHQQMKESQKKWGDIIPPTDARPSGLNWTTEGQAVWKNGCNYVNKVATATVKIEDATCNVGQKLVYGPSDAVNATFDAGSTPSGTTGVAPGTNYLVTATSNLDALFAANDVNINASRTQKTFSGTLSGQIPAQNTNPQGNCYYTVPDATAVVTTIPATCDAAEKLVWGNIQNATFSGTPDGTPGPGTYDVTATANVGHTFAGGALTLNFTDTLDGQIPSQSTNPQGDCYVPLPKDAVVVVDKIPATCENGEILVFDTLTHATFTSGDPEGTEGPYDYSSTFTATAGHTFASGLTTETKTGELAGPLTEGCGEEEPGVATASVRILDATCEAGEKLVYVNVTNASATQGSTPDGTVGLPTPYSVEFVADQGSAFAANAVTTFQGTLAGPDTGEDCVLSSTTTTPTPSTPSAPAVLPATTGESTAAIVLGGSLLAVVLGFAGARRILARSL